MLMSTDIASQIIGLSTAYEMVQPSGGKVFVPAVRQAQQAVEYAQAGQPVSPRPLLDVPPLSLDIYV